MAESIERVVEILGELGIDWCLIGAHAVAEYTEPRATADVDILVDERRMSRLLARVKAELGELDDDDIGPAVRLRTIGVDLVKASSNLVFTAAVREAVEVGRWRIPARETLIVMKFMAATSPFRGLDRRRQDKLDLVRLYRAADPDTVDRARLDRLASMLYSGAKDELHELLDRIDRDDPLEI